MSRSVRFSDFLDGHAASNLYFGSPQLRNITAKKCDGKWIAKIKEEGSPVNGNIE